MSGGILYAFVRKQSFLTADSDRTTHNDKTKQKGIMMKYRHTILFLLVLPLWGISRTTTGAVTGTVLTYDHQPVEMANVVIKEKSVGTITDGSGSFRLDHVEPGIHTLVVSLIGYESYEITVLVHSDSTTKLPPLLLHERTAQMQEVIVSGDKESYKAVNVSPSMRLQTKLLDIPQNIQVITNKVIEDQQIHTMIEGVTRNVSGVSRVEHWDNIYARLYTRGSHIPGYRNGMNIATTWGPLVEDMSTVERIEFVKGPAGFMLSNGEPGGFYNVVTKKPSGLIRRSFELTAGSFGTYRASADLDGILDSEGTFLYRLNAMGQKKSSHVDYDYNDRYSIAPVLTYELDRRSTITAEYTYQFSQFLQPAAYVFSGKGYADVPVNFTAYDSNLDPTAINDHSFFAYFTHQLDDQWKATAQAGYFHNTVRGYDVWPGSIDSAGNLSRTLFTWDAQNDNTLAQVFINGTLQTGGISHTFLAGLDMGNKNSIADFGTAGALPALNIYRPAYGIPPADIPTYDFTPSLERRHNYSETGTYEALYLQDEIGVYDDHVRFTVAGRYTHSQSGSEPYEDVLTPRFGVSASVLEGTSVYVLYDRSYIPNSGEDFFGNRFKPVMGDNVEAGVKREWFDAKWNSTVSLYRITKTNVLTADPDHVNFSVQLGEIATEGIEVDIVGEILPGLSVAVNYAFTDSRISKDTDPSIIGNETPGSIKQIHNTWLSYTMNDGALHGMGFSLGYQYQVDRISWYVWDGSSQKLPHYFRVDGGISWANEKFNCALTVNNLLNDYLYSGFPPTAWYNFYTWISEPPRNFRLTLGYKI